MGRNEVIEKARDLIAPALGREASTRVIDTILDIENVAEVRSLLRLLRRS
jgi:hypothetical protein